MTLHAADGPALSAFRLSEELAAEGYLTARKAMVALAARVDSLRQLVSEQPLRADYRAALRDAEAAHAAAAERTELAFDRYHAAQLRSDSFWTATTGKAA